METDVINRLRLWSDRILNEPTMENSDFWYPVWERGGKLLCVHCGAPIYCDDGPGAMSSGYYFHINKTDGMNGLYCSAPFGKGKTAYPDETALADQREIAIAVREFINEKEENLLSARENDR